MGEFAHTTVAPERIQVCNRRMKEMANIEGGTKGGRMLISHY